MLTWCFSHFLLAEAQYLTPTIQGRRDLFCSQFIELSVHSLLASRQDGLSQEWRKIAVYYKADRK